AARAAGQGHRVGLRRRHAPDSGRADRRGVPRRLEIVLLPVGGPHWADVHSDRRKARESRPDLRQGMMDDRVPVGGRLYCFFLALLLLSRGADFLSTWIATPNLVLEGNPLARRLGWKWGSLVNLLLCGVFASWPVAAIVIGTTS